MSITTIDYSKITKLCRSYMFESRSSLSLKQFWSYGSICTFLIHILHFSKNNKIILNCLKVIQHCPLQQMISPRIPSRSKSALHRRSPCWRVCPAFKVQRYSDEMKISGSIQWLNSTVLVPRSRPSSGPSPVVHRTVLCRRLSILQW